MKYVIDIDGTICTETSGNYENAAPVRSRIKKINNLYDSGHTIVYFTARGMGRFRGVEKLAADMFYGLTKKQLDNWGCKYHELILGKPSSTFYIDDKGIAADDFFRD